jgi:hypothetical protein
MKCVLDTMCDVAGKDKESKQAMDNTENDQQNG